MANRWDLFWRFHSRNKPGELEFWGDELIDLLSTMLMPDENMRPSYAEVMAHPWLQGPTTDPEEFKADFEERKSQISSSTSSSEPESPEPNIFTTPGATRSVSEDESLDL